MADDTWDDLVATHRRTKLDATGQFPDHAPKAAILACSDARVPPSLIFGQDTGSLFVVRIAGNTASPAAVASLDYAVSELGVGLVVVLGHTGCGAVQAAASGTCGGHLAPILASICELLKANPTATAERLVELNVEHTMNTLVAHPGPTGEATRAGSLQLRGAVHDLRNRSLSLITTNPKNPQPTIMETL